MGAVTILVCWYSKYVLCSVLTAVLHKEDDIPKSIVILGPANISTRVDAMKIQRIAIAAIFTMIILWVVAQTMTVTISENKT